MMLGGIALVISGLPSWGNALPGAFLLGLGWFTRPRFDQRKARRLNRSEVPKTFALLDQICAKLEAPAIDAVELGYDANAFMAQPGVIRRKGTILGIGAILWLALDDDEKVALLAHEVGHLVNKDPARGRLLGGAISVVVGWIDFFDSPEAEEGFFLTELIFNIMAWAAALVWLGLNALYNLSSQRAEYLADGLAAQVAGRAAKVRLLRRLVVLTKLDEAMANYRPSVHKDHDGAGILKHFAQTVAELPQSEKDALYDKATAEHLSVDTTHPPTVFRIGFVSEIALDTAGSLTVAPDLIRDVDAELAQHWDRLGRDLYGRYLDATT
jgi:heat shock protein HtpX